MNQCCFCEAYGPLVRITCSRSDTSEVLDSAVVCPECFRTADMAELFSIGVVSCDAEGVAHLCGHSPEA